MLKRRAFLLSLVVAILLIHSVSKAADKKTWGPAATVVKIYCTLDALGAGLSSDGGRYLQPLVTWSNGPGWDIIAYIEGFNILSESYESDKAVVKVEYEVVGRGESQEAGGSRFIPEKKEKKVVDYNLVMTEGDWRIVAPQLKPHVYYKQNNSSKTTKVLD